MIIGIAGRKRVGKNFVGDVFASLLKRDQDVKLVAFADPIKRYCNEILGINEHYLWGDGDKNTTTRYEWKSFDQATIGRAGINMIGPPGIPPVKIRKGFMTVREIMQVVGTELGRNVWGKDIWINALRHEIDKGKFDSYIVTDVRMVNEAEAVRKWGGIVIRVDGAPRGLGGGRLGDGPVDSHETERMIDSLEVDVIIHNGPSMTRMELERQAKEIMRKHLKWE